MKDILEFINYNPASIIVIGFIAAIIGALIDALLSGIRDIIEWGLKK